MNTKINKLQNSAKYPTTLLVRGADQLGVEVAKSLLEQGGYVVIIDHEGEESRRNLAPLADYELLTLLDFSAIDTLEDDLRRLDYVFYLQHNAEDLKEQVASQEFLQFSNYLDSILDLTAKFEAKFLLTTSIKAHQLIVANNPIEMAYNLGASESHARYTELEMQRYAESLVKEYSDKVGIDTRIIRLAQLIGEGAELSHESKLLRIILDGLQSDTINIPGDGLESDFYIHNLDAAYGLLKAQFSANTKGQIYTLANEEEISMLSIGYKLLEIIDDAKDIAFRSDDNSIPPLKLYKPAANLTTIGWKPRISFDRALAQTVDFIKQELTSAIRDSVDNANHLDADGAQTAGLWGKVMHPFRSHDEDAMVISEHLSEDDSDLGALSRLISERKKQEQARKGSIILGNTKLKEKSKPVLTFWGKIADSFNHFVFFLQARFKFLKNVSVADFVMASVGTILFIIAYFMLITPVIQLAKHIYIIDNSLGHIQKNVENYQFSQANVHGDRLEKSLFEIQTTLEDLQFVFEISGKQNEYREIQQFLDVTSEYFSGYSEMLVALDPLGEYIYDFNPQLSYSFSNSDLLRSSDESDYTNSLNEFAGKERLINLGYAKVVKNQNAVSKELQDIPDFISKRLTPKFESLQKYNESIDFIGQVYPYLPVLLGQQVQSNVLIVVQDNSRYTVAGGEIAGYIVLSLDKGKIANVEVVRIDEIAEKLDGVLFSDLVLDQMNLVSVNDVRQSNLGLSDIAMIADRQLFLKTAEEIFVAQNPKNISLVMSVNLMYLEEVINKTGDLNYRDTNISANDLLDKLNNLTGEQATQIDRSEVIINLMGMAIERQFNTLGSNLPNHVLAWQSLFGSSNIAVYSSNQSVSNMLAVVEQSSIVNDTIEYGLNHNRSELNIESLPISTTVIDISIGSNLEITKSVEMQTQGAESLANTYLCVPRLSKDITFPGVSANLITNTYSKDRICTIFLPGSQKYSMKSVGIQFANSAESEYNYSLEVTSNPGLSSNLEITFAFDDGLEVVPLHDDYIVQSNSYIFSKAGFEGSKIFNFTIKKR